MWVDQLGESLVLVSLSTRAQQVAVGDFILFIIKLYACPLLQKIFFNRKNGTLGTLFS